MSQGSLSGLVLRSVEQKTVEKKHFDKNYQAFAVKTEEAVFKLITCKQ